MDVEQEKTESPIKQATDPKAALIVSEYTISEYSASLRYLLGALEESSVPAALVCSAGCDVESIVNANVEVFRHPAIDLPLMGRQNRKMLLEKLRKFEPTILHCLCESQASLSRRLSRKLDLPYILSVNSLQKRFSNFSISAKRCAKIIVPAESIAANIEDVHPHFAEKLMRINFGTCVAETAACFSKPTGPGSMVVAAPLEGASGLDNLLEAVHHLAVENYDFMLVIITGSQTDKDLRKRIASLGLSQFTVIVSRQHPWDRILAAGDIFIQPWPCDDFNPMLLEAMSQGTAVAACTGRVDDLVIDEQTAVTFDPEDQLSIYNSLKGLFDRPELAKQIAAAAQQHLRKNNSIEETTSQIIELYREPNV
ncbi:glycosyltransferase family 4 protein [Planctomycetota bacterium]